MFSKVFSYAIVGLEAYRIHIEVDISPGLPCTVVVGLPDNAVKESKERVRSAIKNSHYEFPAQRITINLSPGDLKKEGPCFDLGMALGILACSGKISTRSLERYVILGELSLDGKIRPIKGAFLAASSLSKHPCEGIGECRTAVFPPTETAACGSAAGRGIAVSGTGRVAADAGAHGGVAFCFQGKEVCRIRTVLDGLETGWGAGSNGIRVGIGGNGHRNPVAHQVP